MREINNCGDNRAFGKGTMKLKKNTFYQYKDADTYSRVDDIHTNKYVVTIFSKNFVEIGKILWDIEDLDG